MGGGGCMRVRGTLYGYLDRDLPGAFLSVADARRSPLGTSPPLMSIEPIAEARDDQVVGARNYIQATCARAKTGKVLRRTLGVHTFIAHHFVTNALCALSVQLARRSPGRLCTRDDVLDRASTTIRATSSAIGRT